MFTAPLDYKTTPVIVGCFFIPVMDGLLVSFSFVCCCLRYSKYVRWHDGRTL